MGVTVVCPAVDCKYRSYEDGECKADRIGLIEHYIMTMYQGRKHFWTCKRYELSDQAKRINKELFEMGLIDGGDEE